MGGAVAIFVIGYLVFTMEFCSPYAGPADSSGYLNSARFVLDHKSSVPVPVIPGLDPKTWDLRLQEPLGFLVRSDQAAMVPSYPVGYPLHLALAALLVGLDNATAPVNALLAVASALLMAAFCRRLHLPWSWSLAAVALLWTNPLFMRFLQVPMSDAPATVWVMASVWFALCARDKWAWGIAAGFAVAIAVLVRPSDMLVLLPMAVALGPRWRAWLAVVSGGLPGAALLAWYNLNHYGGAFTNGAGNPICMFGIGYVFPNAAHFSWWLLVLLSPPVLLAALCAPLLRRREPAAVGVLSAWIGVFIAFYLLYSQAHETWWSLRFILPAFPALILSGLLVVHAWTPLGGARTRSRIVPPLLLAGILAWQFAAAGYLRAVAYRRESIYPVVADWMNRHIPSNAIVLQMLSSGASAYYTRFDVVRWDLISPEQARLLYAAAKASDRPVYACLIDFEAERAFPDHLPGNWQRLATVKQAGFWRLIPAPTSP
jgi:4-amino-4-deoxy-L-arabinose transferase-like glycosyltransferase